MDENINFSYVIVFVADISVTVMRVIFTLISLVKYVLVFMLDNIENKTAS